jgi:mannitol/fructose-specific phosphotransferase system IIA component (Ntr-type)
MLTDRLLSSLLTPDRVRVGLDAATKGDVLRGVVALAATSPAVLDAARLLADVEAREATLSTGVGGGLALPHARSVAVRETVAALATLAAPVDFESLDGAPVRLVLLLAGPDGDPGAHVRLLSRVSRLMSRDAVRERLMAAADPTDFCAALAEAEDALA